jgi:hypothetical protein
MADFCFPEGVRVIGMKRSNSGSNLNELMFGKRHLRDNNHSFVFRLKSDTTLYGICIFKQELLEVSQKGKTERDPIFTLTITPPVIVLTFFHSNRGYRVL